MRFTVALTARAVRDLDSACAYIGQASPEAAKRWRVGLLKAVLQLGANAEIWPLAPESEQFPFELRQCLFRTKSRRANRILFTIDGDHVRVLAIRRPGLPLVTKDDFE